MLCGVISTRVPDAEPRDRERTAIRARSGRPGTGTVSRTASSVVRAPANPCSGGWRGSLRPRSTTARYRTGACSAGGRKRDVITGKTLAEVGVHPGRAAPLAE
jgi:hypothetical protein